MPEKDRALDPYLFFRCPSLGLRPLGTSKQGPPRNLCLIYQKGRILRNNLLWNGNSAGHYGQEF